MSSISVYLEKKNKEWLEKNVKNVSKFINWLIAEHIKLYSKNPPKEAILQKIEEYKKRRYEIEKSIEELENLYLRVIAEEIKTRLEKLDKEEEELNKKLERTRSYLDLLKNLLEKEKNEEKRRLYAKKINEYREAEESIKSRLEEIKKLKQEIKEGRK